MAAEVIGQFSVFGDLVEDIVNGILDKVLRPIRELAQRAWDKAQEAAGNVKSGIGNTADSLGSFTSDISSAIGEGIRSAVSGIVSGVSSVFDGVRSKINAVVDNFRGAFSNAVASFQQFISPITERVSEIAGSIRDGLSNVIENLGETVRNIASGVSTAISDTVGPILERFKDSFARLISKISDGITAFKDTIGKALNSVGVRIRDTVVALTDSFGRTVENITNGLRSGFTTLANRLGEFAGGIRDGITRSIEATANRIQEAVQGFVALVSQLPEALELAFGNALEFVFGFTGEELAGVIGDHFAPALDELEGSEFLPDWIKKLSPEHASPLAPVLAFVGGIAVASSLGSIITILSSPYLERAAQGMSARAQQSIPPIQTVIEGWRRGLLTEEQATELTLRSGFPPELTEFLQRIDKQLLRLDEVQALNLRGVIEDGDADNRLIQLGFASDDIPLLKNLFFIRPPVQDVIRMAVREVFTPEIAERFGQFEDFPEEFVAAAHEVGLRESDALNYWAAHWDLPSIGQGFEMLHRRVIESDELDILLRARDVMPFWRDKLTAISFRPLTRVDVRRMHLEGVITEAEVFDAYLDFGYAPANARRMTDFTVAWNARREESQEKENKDNTKSEITKLYRLRRIGSEDAISMLVDIGIKPEASAITIALVDFQREDNLIEQRIKTVQRQFTGAQITEEEALTLLDGLNLSNEESQTRVALWREQRKEEHAPIPTKGDFMDALDKGVILKDFFIVSMADRLGYSPIDIELLGRLAIGKTWDDG